MIFNESKFNRNWNIKKLNQLGEFKRGKSKHRPRNDEALFVGGKYPLVQTGEIKEANLYIRNHTQMYNDFGLKQSKLWRENTLCITIAANIAETALLGYPMCFPDSVVGFNAFPKESSEIFMHYIFTYLKEAIQNSASGSIQDNINIEYLTGLTLRIPDKAYQDKIAAVLSALDAKIELNTRINATLESMAKTLYDYWFVQFHPTPTAAEAAPPPKTTEVPSFLGEEGRGLVWNDESKRKIPLGWEVKSLAEITKVSTTTVNPLNYPQKKFKHYSIPAFDETGTYKIEFGEEIMSNKFIVQHSDLLVSKLNPWFNRVVYATNDTDLICSSEFVVWRTENKPIKNYLYMVAKDAPFIGYCTRSASGTSHSHRRVNPQVMMKYQVAYNQEVANKFGTIINPMIETIANNQIESQRLRTLRDWLLPMLMNGQINIKT